MSTQGGVPEWKYEDSLQKLCPYKNFIPDKNSNKHKKTYALDRFGLLDTVDHSPGLILICRFDCDSDGATTAKASIPIRYRRHHMHRQAQWNVVNSEIQLIT